MPLEAASGHGHGAVPFTTADGMTPLYLSTMAGMSTCLGAAIVFCHPKQSANDPRRIVSPAMMAFSLALAGSVMLTVSIISIGPECLHEPSHEQDRGEGTRYIPLFSWLFAQRLLSFGLGCTFYGLLRMLFSDPDDIEAELLATMTRDDQWLDRKEVGEEGHPLAAEREDPFDASEKETSVRKRKASPTDSEFELSLNGNRRNRRSDPGRSVSSLSFGSWASGHDLASREQRRAWRIAMLLFVSLLAHNLPEGMGKSILTARGGHMSFVGTYAPKMKFIPAFSHSLLLLTILIPVLSRGSIGSRGRQARNHGHSWHCAAQHSRGNSRRRALPGGEARLTLDQLRPGQR